MGGTVKALIDGLEWNVRLSHVETSQVLRQFQTAFEQYWEEGEFEAYDPATDAGRVDEALKSEQRTGAETLALRIDVRPYPFQQETPDPAQPATVEDATRVEVCPRNTPLRT